MEWTKEQQDAIYKKDSNILVAAAAGSGKTAVLVERIIQKILKDNVLGEKEAKDVHYEVGKKVRKAIADIGGMMPEEMPTPKKSLKELEREKKQLENKEKKRLEEIR